MHEALLGTKSKTKLKIKEDGNSIEDECVPSDSSSDNENEFKLDK